MLEDNSIYNLQGTKAETLANLQREGYNVPNVLFFKTEEWLHSKEIITQKILDRFKDNLIAVRSSTNAEDTADSSMAGAFESILNVENKKKSIENAVNKVIASYDDDLANQVLIQPMVANVKMSGVIMSKVLDDGSPYHVFNYDDKTGLTDTVTSGSSINKTVYVYNGVKEEDFDSQYLLAALKLVRKLESRFPNIPLDIEFAIDNLYNVYLLQVRKITTIKKWNQEVNSLVTNRIELLKTFIKNVFSPRSNLFGDKTLLGFMPDWNPAEMIGIVPSPLSMSLYRKLITESTWRLAREQMGYRKMPNVDLMISLFGRTYIDVRNSMNSFLPEGLNDIVSQKLVNAFIDRLEKNPHFHDKIEFEVVPTAYDFDFESNFKKNYPDLLTKEEFNNYKLLLKNLTIKSVSLKKNSSLFQSLEKIKHLEKLQECIGEDLKIKTSFSLADYITTLIDECIKFGTIPFSVLARHGFIAESLLRSVKSHHILSEDRLNEFRQSIVTVAGEMSSDFQDVIKGSITKDNFLKKYGHLRPSSYDIMSPNYKNRKDLFNGEYKYRVIKTNKFILSNEEKLHLEKLLLKHGLFDITAEDFLKYAEKSIQGREYAKFIFTKHLSEILEKIAEWGALKNINRQKLSMLSINDITNILYAPLSSDVIKHYEEKINNAKQNFKVASSFKLSYLIRSVRDVYIVPMQRSAPNFIGAESIEGKIIELSPLTKSIPNLDGKIILIEGADPGYDWIFTRNILGLITKFGGSNSHMAIRCAEYGIPAAIGCGEQPYERVKNAGKCILDCVGKRLEPIQI